MKFVFVVPPLAGHVNPTLGLGAELIQRGHAVAWISVDESLGASLPAGGELLLVKEGGAAGEGGGHGEVSAGGGGARGGEGEVRKDETQVGRIMQKDVYGIESIKFLYDEVLIPLNRYMSAGIGAHLDQYRPDVLINDHQLFAGAVAARKKKIRYATSVTAPAAIKMREDLPGVHQWEVQRMVALQKELGIEGEACVACSDELVLLFTSKEFFGGMELSGEYRFVGPVIRRPAVAGLFDWEQFHRMTGGPRILVSIGTTFDHRDKKEFLGKVIAAFGNEPLSVVLVSDPLLIQEWPDNFLVQGRVPQLELLSQLDAVVCHGGHNTVCEALTYGLPLVVLPIAYDQSHVASRVVQTECGMRLNFKRFRIADLRGAVWEVLREAKYRLAAERIGASFRAAGGVERAAELLEEMGRGEGSGKEIGKVRRQPKL
jgi:MGT family glycosyltransferase